MCVVHLPIFLIVFCGFLPLIQTTLFTFVVQKKNWNWAIYKLQNPLGNMNCLIVILVSQKSWLEPFLMFIPWDNLHVFQFWESLLRISRRIKVVLKILFPSIFLQIYPDLSQISPNIFPISNIKICIKRGGSSSPLESYVLKLVFVKIFIVMEFSVLLSIYSAIFSILLHNIQWYFVF